LVRVEAEVDWHEDATRSADAEERGHEPGRVVRDDGDTRTALQTHRVERGRLGPGPARDLEVGEAPPRLRGLIGFVDDADAFPVPRPALLPSSPATTRPSVRLAGTPRSSGNRLRIALMASRRTSPAHRLPGSSSNAW